MSTPYLKRSTDGAQLTQSHIDQARQGHLLGEGTFVECLGKIAALDDECLMRALSEKFTYPSWSMDELRDMTVRFDVIPFTEASSRGVLVLQGADGNGQLLLSNPFDGEAEEWAMHRCQSAGVWVDLVLVHPTTFQAFMAQQERQLRAMDGFAAGAGGEHDEDVVATITLTSLNAEESEIVRLVNSTIYDALKLQASDIHLECDAGSLRIVYRIDGVLVPITEVSGQAQAEQVISRIKVMADLDISERRVPQDGRFKVKVNGRDVDFRVSVMPNIFGEDAVLRLLDRQALTEEAQSLSLESLGLDSKTIRSIRKLALKPHGMLLITGPTGSGKTTTLYAAITEIHTGHEKIITIEDPVEYRLPRVLQIPVNEKKGLTFARGLRSILRHDPDKIMVGEIRDDETAQIAVQSALTGHLVFTSVHANSVFDVLGRFLHMGVDAYSFASALNGVVAQRLLRVNCTHCKVSVLPSPELLEDAGLSGEAAGGWSFMAGQGCAHCRGVGYKGRKAIAEVLVLDDVLREMIANRAPISQLKAKAKADGMVSILDVAHQWVERGETTLEEVIRVAG